MNARVPLVRRQLKRDGSTTGVSIVIVAACVALVLLLGGLQRGMGEQATTYLDRQPEIIVGQSGASHFLAEVSVLDEDLEQRIEDVPGVRVATPIMQQFAMLDMHGRSIPSVLVGFDPGRVGGPWRVARGRAPDRDGEITLDASFAAAHQVDVGDDVSLRGADLRVVGTTNGTSSFMLPLSFTTRRTMQGLARRPDVASFFLVEPERSATTRSVRVAVEKSVPGVSALDRDVVSTSDRELLVGGFRAPITAMVVISFVISMVVIGVTTHGLVVARRRDLATLKAIGMGTRSLIATVLAAGMSVAVAGLCLGGVMALLGGRLVGELAPRYLISISVPSVVQTVVATLVASLLACAMPLRSTAQIDPASAFRR